MTISKVMNELSFIEFCSKFKLQTSRAATQSENSRGDYSLKSRRSLMKEQTLTKHDQMPPELFAVEPIPSVKVQQH